jgi:hypothetical protein
MPDVGQLKLRLPKEMRRKLERASDQSGRSLNNEILWRLGRSFAAEGDETVAKMAQEQVTEEADARAALKAMVDGWIEEALSRRPKLHRRA